MLIEITLCNILANRYYKLNIRRYGVTFILFTSICWLTQIEYTHLSTAYRYSTQRPWRQFQFYFGYKKVRTISTVLTSSFLAWLPIQVTELLQGSEDTKRDK